MGKGEEFEREQCRQLSLWWTDGKRDDVFWRNRLRKTIKSPDGRHQLGDIIAVDEVGAPFVQVFNVELKRGYAHARKGKRGKRIISWDVLDLIDSVRGEHENKVLFKFWNQCEWDAILSKRFPLLIFKRDFRKPVVCIDGKTFGVLTGYAGNIGDISFNTIVKVCYGSNMLVLINWDMFFNKWISPSIVKLMAVGES